MKLVTSEQMRRIDLAAIEGAGISSEQLMENAGRGIADAVMTDILLGDDEPKLVIFCGKGNNGGDGFVIGRHLYQAGYKVVIYYLGLFEKMSDDAALNFNRLKELEFSLYEVSSVDDLPEFLEADYIIDAIFGTGFSGVPNGLAAELIEYINLQPQEVISVDLPSGLNGDSGEFEGEVVEADYTYTLALPKYGLFVSPGREISGLVEIIPIGMPDEIIESFELFNELIDFDYVSDILPARDPEGHKGTFGKLLVLGGSQGMIGAAVLAAASSLRSGCGMVKVACPHSVHPQIAMSVIEATTHPLPDVGKKGKLALRGLGEIKKIITENDALVLGPGLGQHHETKELVVRLLLSTSKPVVVDADGLNAIVGELSVLEDSPSELILTPHPGEFARLSGAEVGTDLCSRIDAARNFAIKYQTILVLKGSPTLVAHYDGYVYLNPTGNNGMATAGSGDVLAGIIGSLLAQGIEPIEAALCGVYVHGLAGDLAAYDLGERSVIASDLIENLPEAFLSL